MNSSKRKEKLERLKELVFPRDPLTGEPNLFDVSAESLRACTRTQLELIQLSYSMLNELMLDLVVDYAAEGKDYALISKERLVEIYNQVKGDTFPDEYLVRRKIMSLLSERGFRVDERVDMKPSRVGGSNVFEDEFSGIQVSWRV